MQSHTEQLIKSTPIRAQWFFRLPSLVSVESFFRAFSSPLFPLIYSKCLKLSFISKIQKIFNETPFFSSKIRWRGKFSGNFFEGNKNIQIEGKAPVSVPMRKLLLNSNSFGFGLQDETIFNWLFNKNIKFSDELLYFSEHRASAVHTKRIFSRNFNYNFPLSFQAPVCYVHKWFHSRIITHSLYPNPLKPFFFSKSFYVVSRAQHTNL